jgi:NAD(P)-dependent dehydrogenase (short-subunit alcohol dehydrogenase family)
MMQTSKTALVTGASRGIGAATALALAADGYHVIVHYGSGREQAEAVVAKIRADGGSADAVGADLARAEAPGELAEEALRLAGGTLHAVVLNAAVMPGNSNLDACSPETFDRIFAVNLRAPFFLLQSLSLDIAQGGSVVLLSSVTARHAVGAVAAYAAMKAALESLVARTAAELGPRGVRVNAVAPGTTASETIAPWTQSDQGREATLGMQALKRINQPEDVADVIAFLCSDKARIVTGAVIAADGGTLL